MEKSPKTLIDEFLAQQEIALAGYSHQPKKFGHSVYKTLKEKGYIMHRFHRWILELFGRLPQ